MFSDTKNLSNSAEFVLTTAFSPVQSLNTTQHNTTQHIEETFSTIHLSGTRPARIFSYEKVPAGLFLFKSFFCGYFPACVTA